MTIVVATAAPDGLVLASDSRSTLLQGRRHRVATDHARKVLVPYKGVAIATYGPSLIGDRTIAGIVDDFAGHHKKKGFVAVGEVSQEIASYFDECLADHAASQKRNVPVGALGLVVAGYTGEGVGEIHEVRLPSTSGVGSAIKREIGTREPGVLYRGRTGYIRRMVEGFDVDGIRSSDVKLPSDAEEKLRGLGYYLKDLISLQDAVDMAAFIVRMTIDMERLTDGTWAQPGDVPGCGGKIQLVAISRTGTEWISEPKLRASDAGLSE